MSLKVESKVIYKSADNTVLIEVDESNRVEVKPYSVNHGNLLELADAANEAYKLIEQRLKKSQVIQ